MLRALVGHDPDVDPGVGLGRNDGLGRDGIRVAGPQALQVQRRLEGHRLRGGHALDPTDELGDGLVPAHVLQLCASPWRRRLPAGRGVGGRIPSSRPRTAGRPSASQHVASAATSRAPALGSNRDTLECESTRIVRTLRVQDDDALAAGDDQGLVAHVHPAALDQRRVGLAEMGPQVEQPVERAAPGLLLALDQVPDAARERAHGLEPGLHGPDARQELALVVGGAARPDAAVADRRLVGRRRPQLEGCGGLDVVMLDGAEGPWPVADLPDDQRRRAVDLEHLDPGPEPLEACGGPVGRAPQPGSVAALGRDGQELDELLRPALEPCLDQAVECLERGGHARLRSRSRKGSSTTVAATRPRRPSTVHSTWRRVPVRS